MSHPKPINAFLVVGGKYHDFDFARLELLKLLAEDERIRTTVGHDYQTVETITPSDFLVTYTCDVRPSVGQQQTLADFVGNGGRWLALHATNAVLERVSEGMSTPDVLGEVATVLGSRFLAHPPTMPYRVEVVAPEHPLVAGIDTFSTVDDELYLSELYDSQSHTVLLATRWTGDLGAGNFIHRDWSRDDVRPVMYLRPYGDGEVLYLTLGHCRGHFDMRPEIDYWPDVQRGSWALPEFTELLQRSLRWASGQLPLAPGASGR